MVNELTPKQEKFVQGLIKGLSQRQAYREAYSTENMQESTIDSEACVLFSNPKISKRYNELMQKLQDESIMSAKERMVWLSDVVKGNVKHISYGGNGEAYENEAYISDKLKAIDTLNKMSGEYVTKVDANVEMNTIRVELLDD